MGKEENRQRENHNKAAMKINEEECFRKRQLGQSIKCCTESDNCHLSLAARRLLVVIRLATK